MKTFYSAILIIITLALNGCSTMETQRSATPASFVPPVDGLEKEPVAVSLFPADQAVLPDSAVAKILSTEVQVYARPKLAIIKFGRGNYESHHYGQNYWRDEDYIKLQQSQIDALTAPLPAEMGEVFPLPSLMMPRQMTIPLLREAAVRVQADLLLIYRVNSDTYTRTKAFAKDKVKAYSTCELVLLDIQTGIAPFTKVMSREHLEVQQAGDLDLSETRRRAEQTAAAEALRAAAEDLGRFLKSVKHRPR